MSTDLAVVGTVVPRMGLVDKVQGKTRYTADLKRPGMLYGRVLRSPHAHARIVNIDIAEAMRIPGVHAVLTHRDVPAVRIDADLLPLDEIVRFVGDEVALVAAESETLAEDALRLIRVEYEVLPAVFDAEEAQSYEYGTGSGRNDCSADGIGGQGAGENVLHRGP